MTIVRSASPSDSSDVGDLLVRFFDEEGFTTPPDELRRRVEPFLAQARSVQILRPGRNRQGVAIREDSSSRSVARYLAFRSCHGRDMHLSSRDKTRKSRKLSKVCIV